MPRKRLLYVELKSGQNDCGPAWIGYATLSKSGVTVYFNGRALKRGGGVSGNHSCIETGDEYWVSGPRKDGRDRHWAGSGVVRVDERALPEYLELRGLSGLPAGYEIATDLVDTEPGAFHDLENETR